MVVRSSTWNEDVVRKYVQKSETIIFNANKLKINPTFYWCNIIKTKINDVING